MNQVTEDTFEQTLKSFIRSEQIDLSTVSFIDPYGMLALLEIGELCLLEDVKKSVILPQSPEVCQNIIEHSETTGYVGIQKYRYQSMNKNIVKIAVMDAGIGFRNPFRTGSS